MPTTNVHSQLTGDEIHIPYVKTFANEAARTGDASTYTSADLYKKALQVDTGVEYILTVTTPVWTPVADVSSVVIEDGGTIGGIYKTNVLCLGDVTMDDDVDVKGNLIVNGILENSGGYELIVYGDLGVRNSMNFNIADITQPQSDIKIWGNMVCKGILFKQSGGSKAELFVSGNLTSESTLGITLDGEDNTGCSPGGDLTVGGDFKAYSLSAIGGINASGDAKDGGTVTVKGDVNLTEDIYTTGGEGGIYAGGNGGDITVDGSLTCDTMGFSGGLSTAENAGNGATLQVGGDLIANEIAGFGGGCDSTDGIHSAGLGGSITVKGNIICDTIINLNGGDRTGTIATPGSGTAPDAGSLVCKGSLVAGYIRMIGGNANADLETSAAGNGGDVTVDGNLILNGSNFSKISGGNSVAGDGGSGGDLTVKGFCRLGEFFNDGGDAADVAKTIGSAGNCEFNSGVSCTVGLSMIDGAGTGTAPTTAVKLSLSGHCSFNSLDVVDRLGAWIYAPYNPATLQVISLPSKVKLNDSTGAETGDISGDISDSIFISGDSTSTWYKLTGTSV